VSKAINANPSRDQYASTSGQTQFIVTFPFEASTDLSVYARSATSLPDDVADLVAPTAYVVSGMGEATGGTVTFNAGRASGDIITIQGNMPIDRTTVFPNLNALTTTLNEQLNDLTIMVKQIQTTQEEVTPKYNYSASILPGQLYLPQLDDDYIWLGTETGITSADLRTIIERLVSGVDFVTGTASLFLPDAQVLGDLTTGLMKNNVTGQTGTVSTAIQNVDYYGPGSVIPVADGGTGATTKITALENLINGTAIDAAVVDVLDKVLIQDNASDALKTVTAGSIADLAPQGDVEGPGASTLTALVRWNNLLGTLVADSTVLLSNAGVLTGGTWEGNVVTVTYGGTGANNQSDAIDNLVSGATITAATIALNDKILIQDTDAANALATITVQSIVDAAPQGDVVGPASSTDNALCRFDGITGKLIQNSIALLTDTGELSGLTQLDVGNLRLEINELSAIDADGDIEIKPNGVGNTLFSNNIQLADGKAIIDGNLTPYVQFDEAANAVNFAALENSANNAPVKIKTLGADPHIDLSIAAKGTGHVLFKDSDVIIGDAGTEDNGFIINSIPYDAPLKLSDFGSTQLAQFILHRHSTQIHPMILTALSNTDDDTHSVVLNDQILFGLYAAGWDGNAYAFAASIIVEVDGTPGFGDMPGRILFKTTPDGTQTPQERLRISQNGMFSVNESADTFNDYSDDETFAGDSPNTIMSERAIKAYVDAQGGGGGVSSWTVITTDQTAAANAGYIVNDPDPIDLTLPATCALGAIIRVVGKGAGGWVLKQNAGQTIVFGDKISTTGAGGSLASTQAKDAVELLCTEQDTEFTVLSSVGLLDII
jgi:hypothetical protein